MSNQIGNKCVVCNGWNADIPLELCDVYFGYYGLYYCHVTCIPQCKKCDEVYNVSNKRFWTINVNYINHSCIDVKCISCDFRIGTELYDYYFDDGIFWHRRCEPTWPICSEVNIKIYFSSFPREYRKYMLFQYWTLRNFIYDKNIVWKIITLAICQNGYATDVQNGIPIKKQKTKNKNKNIKEQSD